MNERFYVESEKGTLVADANNTIQPKNVKKVKNIDFCSLSIFIPHLM
jgi:hypothetical protein